MLINMQKGFDRHWGFGDYAKIYGCIMGVVGIA
jgi:hypothetical protein